MLMVPPTRAWPVLGDTGSHLWALRELRRRLGKVAGHAGPPGRALAFLSEGAPGGACSRRAPLVLTGDTAGRESLPSAGGAAQDELAALGRGAELVVVPGRSTV